MKFAQVVLDESTAVVAQATGEAGSGEWRNLDIALNMYDVFKANWQEREEAFNRGQAIDADKLRFLAPVGRLSKILAIGQNYMDHIREQNGKPPAAPLIFAKMSSSINH